MCTSVCCVVICDFRFVCNMSCTISPMHAIFCVVIASYAMHRVGVHLYAHLLLHIAVCLVCLSVGICAQGSRVMCSGVTCKTKIDRLSKLTQPIEYIIGI